MTGASARLGGELDGVVARARSLAARAEPFLALPAPDAFAALERLVGGRGVSSGIVLFDARGIPRVWSGLHRIPVTADGPELSALTTPFYVWLIARRQTSAGTVAAVTMLARADDMPVAGAALADDFARRNGVRLRFSAADQAPADPDVFDYVLPGRTSDTLFSVRPVPPEQGAAYGRTLAASQRAVLAAALVLLLLAGAVAARASLPLPVVLGVGAVAIVAVAVAPLRQALGAGSLFWPDTYYLRLLGPFTSSAGTVLLTGVILFAAAASLWRQGLSPSRGRVVAAVILTVAAPYVVQALARGIAPPPAGTTTAQWLVWQVALALPSAVLVLLAAALVRGRTAPAHSGWTPYAAVTLAALVAAAGLWLWEPGTAWPEWYPYAWIPALLLAIRPMRFRALLATVAVVAGSSSALLVWGATGDGRMAMAHRDLEGLGDHADAMSVALLERLVRETAVDPPPATAGELFLLWRRSALGAQDYPAALALWTPDGDRAITLDLAELDIPTSVVQRVAQEAGTEALPLVRPVLRMPGLHGIAAIPLANGHVLTIAVGPRSRLVAPTRLARFLVGEPYAIEPPYEMAMVPPTHAGAAGIQWRREGWLVRGERTLQLPDGPRHVHALVDLGGPSALLQRGLLVLAFDVLVLALLFVVLETAAARAGPAVRAWWPKAHRSLRLRLGVSLALFFVVPTVAFAAWSFGRLEDEFRSARSLLLQRTLRDAAAELAQEVGLDDPVALAVASRQVDADLVVARGGVVRSLSAPVLADLGLVDVLVPGRVMRRLAWGDELEAAELQRATPAPTLVGYRLIARREPGESAILAAPEFLSDRALRRRESDLGVAVLVGVVLGVVAAVVLAGFAARALAHPLQALRRAALDVATGAAPALGPGEVPVELESIRVALIQAAADVEQGQHAQRVLAWGEMARQVAHEIKNPLTPIRLGIQHLLRVQAEHPADVDRVLPETGGRILAEIDRLDGIARSFSRFALPGAEGAPVDAVPLAAAVSDVVRLYRMGASGTQVVDAVPAGLAARARRDELVEVLVNLCENARDALARTVTISARETADGVVLEVADDGRGIPPDALPRVFEPRFSTTTSGSGLGLAIAKRLVESWGGRVAITATGPAGTTVRLDLGAA